MSCTKVVRIRISILQNSTSVRPYIRAVLVLLAPNKFAQDRVGCFVIEDEKVEWISQRDEKLLK